MNQLTLNCDYEKDFYAWLRHNVQLLRQRKLTAIDPNNIAEELESMGRSEKRGISQLFCYFTYVLVKMAISTAKTW